MEPETMARLEAAYQRWLDAAAKPRGNAASEDAVHAMLMEYTALESKLSARELAEWRAHLGAEAERQWPDLARRLGLA